MQVLLGLSQFPFSDFFFPSPLLLARSFSPFRQREDFWSPLPTPNSLVRVPSSHHGPFLQGAILFSLFFFYKVSRLRALFSFPLSGGNPPPLSFFRHNCRRPFLFAALCPSPPVFFCSDKVLPAHALISPFFPFLFFPLALQTPIHVFSCCGQRSPFSPPRGRVSFPFYSCPDSCPPPSEQTSQLFPAFFLDPPFFLVLVSLFFFSRRRNGGKFDLWVHCFPNSTTFFDEDLTMLSFPIVLAVFQLSSLMFFFFLFLPLCFCVRIFFNSSFLSLFWFLVFIFTSRA